MEIKNISVRRETYNGAFTALDNVSLSFTNRVNVIYGEPGSGKTTLLETIAGLEKPFQGRIKIEANKFFLMQVPERQFLHTTCLMEICGKECDDESIKEILTAVGLPEEIIPMSPWYLSKGEKKRLTLARILMQDISNHEDNIFLLDDPFGDLDETGKIIIIERFLKENKFKIIMATSNKADLKYLQIKKIDFKLFNLSEGKVID